METQLKVENEWQVNIAPLQDHALLIRRKIYQVQLKFADEFYNIKQAETRLQEISVISTDFRTRTLEIAEIIQGQLTCDRNYCSIFDASTTKDS